MSGVINSHGGDHPRMCGEHQAHNISKTGEQGSSPHVRGTPVFNVADSFALGIIPACAGNTSLLCDGLLNDRDHPRMCGEHSRETQHAGCQRGSSPHVRGTLKFIGMSFAVMGIIPACAGNTGLLIRPCADGGDHPRMCGEHCCSSFRLLFVLGSSPHVRGTPPTVTVLTPTDGIIPACAGNTRPPLLLRRFRRDHPRMCGEHCTRLLFAHAE